MPDQAAASMPLGQSRKAGGPRGLRNRLRHLLGMRQTLTVGGVLYREISSESLRRAFSKSGKGHKDYDAFFPDGSTMRIRCRADRVYADLMGTRPLRFLHGCERLLRPGARLMVFGGGTGFIGHWASCLVAQFGAVVSLEWDEESVEYARRRYPQGNVSFESLEPSSIAGETDGSFHAVLVIPRDLDPAVAERSLPDLWRTVAPGGWLMLVMEHPGSPTLSAAADLACANGGRSALSLRDARDGWLTAVYSKPEPS